jgi:hypothetical protein
VWLLHQYIQKKEPETKVIYFDNWPEGNPLRHWSDYLTSSGWKWQDSSIIILDEGRTIYCGSESRLWAFFKNVLDDQGLYQNWVIVFTHYISPTGSIPLIQTSIFILSVKRVTLYSVNHNDRTAAASLFLTPPEFNDLVSRWYLPNDYHFDSTFFSWISRFTARNLGSILDLISLITSKDAITNLLRNTKDSKGFSLTASSDINNNIMNTLRIHLEHTQICGCLLCSQYLHWRPSISALMLPVA